MGLDIRLYYEIDGNEIEVYDDNITHNLGKMADEAGMYEALWRPDENNYEFAHQILPILEKGLLNMESDYEHYQQFNSPNGWGTYDDLHRFVSSYIEACKKYPSTKISVWR